jgi:signal transduction histidine kinase
MTAALIVILIGTGLFYFFLNRIMDEEVNEQLMLEKTKISRELDKPGEFSFHFLSAGDDVTLASCQDTVCSPKDIMRDTTIYQTEAKEELPYRKLIFRHRINEKDGKIHCYQITVTKALFEDDDLIFAIVKSMLILLSILLIALYQINRSISRKIWKPFYESIARVEAFNISQDYALSFSPSGIQEFDELNSAFGKMTEKISRDYHSLRDFSENASHEIQTPLAIIKNKLEMLIQSKDLREDQLNLIRDAYESAGRLSRLNQALILLTRIENNQFTETKNIALDELINSKLENYAELLQHKNIKLSTSLEEMPVLNMNPALADILLSNLIGNAIKHNIVDGQLEVSTTKDKLVVSNTGEKLDTDPSKLFERFRKGNASSDSLGLGLAIVKQICETNGIRISYSYHDKFHRLVLNFPLA